MRRRCLNGKSEDSPAEAASTDQAADTGSAEPSRRLHRERGAGELTASSVWLALRRRRILSDGACASIPAIRGTRTECEVRPSDINQVSPVAVLDSYRVKKGSSRTVPARLHV
jgi:hypothetical protein